MKKTKTVYDTNVIIDFKAGKIREAMFSSGETVAINREVYEDELRKERKYLAQYQRTGVLEIINRNIADCQPNYTKFICISKEFLKQPDHLGFGLLLFLEARRIFIL